MAVRVRCDHAVHLCAAPPLSACVPWGAKRHPPHAHCPRVSWKMPHCPWGPCSGDRKEQEPGLGEQRAESGHAGGRWPRVKGSARPWRPWREDRSLDSRSRPPVFSTWAPGDSICVLPLGPLPTVPQREGPPSRLALPAASPRHPGPALLIPLASGGGASAADPLQLPPWVPQVSGLSSPWHVTGRLVTCSPGHCPGAL